MIGPTAPRAETAGAARALLHDLFLLRELVKRDFAMRFTGSALGVAWAILQPLSLVVLYWFVFTVMIPRSPVGPGAGASPKAAMAASADYVLFLISGLLPWIGFSEGVIRGTTSIVDNSAMVRKLTFRSELLPVVPNLSAILFQLIGIGLFVGYLLVRGYGAWGIWVLPIALAIQLTLQVGLAWILSTVHVFFRDVVQVLGFLMSILFYLSPILYAVEGRFEKYFVWNPLTPLLGLFRSALLGSPLPEAGWIVLLLVVSFGVFAGGLRIFRRAQPVLGDLI